MGKHARDLLRDALDADEARRALKKLCAPIGRLESVLLSYDHERHALQCLVRLSEPGKHLALASEVGGELRGRDVFIEVLAPAYLDEEGAPARAHARQLRRYL